MSETVNEELYRRAVELLEPGDIDLRGAVVHTDLTSEEESILHQLTLAVGDAVAERVVGDAGDTYVYSGNDDERFGLNQHQGLTVDGDEFVWECQQLLREGTYDLVVYWEAAGEFDAILSAAADLGEARRVVGVTEDGYGPNA